MTGFRKGDYIFQYEGQAVYLRLTLGALAEICAALNSENPLEIAAKVRSLSLKEMIIIFSALSRPVHQNTINFSKLNLTQALPVLATIIETTFAPLSPEVAS